MVYDLSELLTAAGEHGPFIMVADGFSTATARVYAAQHADSVEALVLLGPERRPDLARGGEAIDLERTERQAVAAVVAKRTEVVVMSDDSGAPALKEKPAEVIETIRGGGYRVR